MCSDNLDCWDELGVEFDELSRQPHEPRHEKKTFKIKYKLCWTAATGHIRTKNLKSFGLYICYSKNRKKSYHF